MRFGDLVRMAHEPVLDLFEGVGFLQGSVLRQKTSGPTPSLPLPVVALAGGVTGKPWAARWLAARAACGVRADRRSGLTPMLGLSGWLSRRMRTHEAGHWIREFATSLTQLPTEVVKSFGASSFKPTLLSWVAKFGIDTGSRRLLGYHVKPKDKSVLIYSRDALAKPLRELGGVLDSVRRGSFLPDSDRSGRFRVETPAVVPAAEIATEVSIDREDAGVDLNTSSAPARPSEDPAPGPGEVRDRGSDDEGSSSASSSLSSTGSPEVPADEVIYVSNVRAKMLYIEAGDGLLACGRPYPRSFSVLRAMPEGLTACRRCFKSEVD